MAVEIPGAHFEGKIAQKVIIERDGKILLCRNTGAPKWDLPGGRLHKGELPEEGLRREIEEELGVEVEVGEVIHLATFNMNLDGAPHFYVAYRAKLKDPSQALTLAQDEIEAVQFVGKDEFEIVEIRETCKESLRRYFR